MVVGLADMMICGRDSNTSSALGNQFIANANANGRARGSSASFSRQMGGAYATTTAVEPASAC